MVRGDHERLHQVVANLLSNARVHTPAGTRVETSVTQVVLDGNPTVELSVTDSGPGIEPRLIPELFERFSRADGSRSRIAGSTGLGLAIVSSIVESHSGGVVVESTPGCTTFRISFPCSVAPVPAVPIGVASTRMANAIGCAAPAPSGNTD